MRQLPRGTLIHDEVHGVTYRLHAKLGQGGFGTAYRAVELNRNGGEKRGSATCIKLPCTRTNGMARCTLPTCSATSATSWR